MNKNCDICNALASHSSYSPVNNLKRYYCCFCWVTIMGNPPADWHKDCLEAYESVKKARSK